MANSRYQKFKVETINRSDIQNAAYNPRIMDKGAKKRLKEGLEKHGLVSAITWNKRTGNLVGGHQRLEQLDSLEKNKNYSLDVCVVDVDEREEALLNIQLNNPSMQGDWDIDKLGDIVQDFDINFDDMGFTQLDVDLMFDGDDRFSKLFEKEEVEETKDTLAQIKEARTRGKERLEDKNNINWYSVLIFENEKDREEFYKLISVPVSEEYITVDKIMRLVK